MSHALWHEQVKNMRERLSEPLLWFPFPALIAFGLVIVLRGQLFAGFNHRLGTEANVVEMPAEPLRSPGIWLSITQRDNDILIITDDHKSFRVPLAAPNVEALQPLVHYLDQRVRDIAFKSTLDLKVDQDRIRAVLAVDQKLRYIHVRPILYALAEAKISNYGFETKLVSSPVAKRDSHADHPEEHL